MLGMLQWCTFVLLKAGQQLTLCCLQGWGVLALGVEEGPLLLPYICLSPAVGLDAKGTIPFMLIEILCGLLHIGVIFSLTARLCDKTCGMG